MMQNDILSLLYLISVIYLYVMNACNLSEAWRDYDLYNSTDVL